MKAIQLAKYGGPDVLVLNEVPRPKCNSGDVLVHVQAVGLNYVDILIRRGSHLQASQFPAVMPGEVEGIIEEVGADVKYLQPGQRVTGYSRAGYAQLATIPADQITVLPDDLPLGKGLLIQHLTARNLLNQATSYQSLAITAAAGGVGSSVVAMANAKGVKTIIGLVGDSAKISYVKSLGATDVIVYTEENWFEQLKEITKQKGVDLIMDAVGGTIGSTLVRQLSDEGTLVIYGNSSGEPSPITLQNLMPGRKAFAARLYGVTADLRNHWANEIVQLIQSGDLNFSLTFYSLADAAKAHSDMESRTSTGRLILKP